MRRVGLVGLIAGALLTAGVASAAAAPPEFGRCVKVAVGTGAYAVAKCTEEGGERKYEWLPGPGPKTAFTLSLKPETTFFFEATRSKVRLTCTGETGGGDISGAATVGNITLTLTKCESGSLPCNSAGAGEGEVLLTGGTGTLGVIKAGETPLKDKIGLDLAGEVAAECGRGLVTIHVHGRAIATVGPVNAMALKHTWKFTEKYGFQKPTMFEGGAPETFEWTLNGTPEQLGLSLTNFLLTEEKIEINTVV